MALQSLGKNFWSFCVVMQVVAFVFIDNSLYFEEFRNVISLSEADIKSLISNIFNDVFLGKLIELHRVIIFSNIN